MCQLRSLGGDSVWRIGTEKSWWLWVSGVVCKRCAPKTSGPKGLCHVTAEDTGAAMHRHEALIPGARCPQVSRGQNESVQNHKVHTLQLSRTVSVPAFLQGRGWLLTAMCAQPFSSPV